MSYDNLTNRAAITEANVHGKLARKRNEPLDNNPYPPDVGPLKILYIAWSKGWHTQKEGDEIRARSLTG